MKSLIFLSAIFVAFIFLSCEKEKESQFNGSVTFNLSSVASDVIVKYSDIETYDSAQHVFQLNTKAWEKIEDKITPIYPDPNFGFAVTVNSEIIYKTSFIPGYYSYSYPELIKFDAITPNFIFLRQDNYTGNEDVNDGRIIEILSKDGKLKSIDL